MFTVNEFQVFIRFNQKIWLSQSNILEKMIYKENGTFLHLFFTFLSKQLTLSTTLWKKIFFNFYLLWNEATNSDVKWKIIKIDIWENKLLRFC